MKKIVGIIAAAALAAGMLTAQDAGIRIGGWGRAIWAPVTYDGDTIGTLSTTSWGGSHREGLSIIGTSENVGIEVDFCGENMGTNDGAFVWVKPFDFLTLKIGRVRDDTLRGDACYGLWNWRRIGNATDNGGRHQIGENFTFSGAGGGAEGGWVDGANLAITPIEGLYIGLGVGAPTDTWDGTPATDATDVWPHDFHGMAAYTIDGIGTIKAGAFGRPTGLDEDDERKFYCNVQVAFDLTAVDNLFVSLGGKINTGKIQDKDIADVNLYARYNFAPFTFHAVFGTMIGQYGADGSDPEKDWDLFGWGAGVGADIDIGGGMGFNVDVRVTNHVFGAYSEDNDKNDIDCAFLVGFYKGFSNGKVSIGFEGGVNGAGQNFFKANDSEAEGDDFGFAVPVMIEYWF